MTFSLVQWPVVFLSLVSLLSLEEDQAEQRVYQTLLILLLFLLALDCSTLDLFLLQALFFLKLDSFDHDQMLLLVSWNLFDDLCLMDPSHVVRFDQSEELCHCSSNVCSEFFLTCIDQHQEVNYFLDCIGDFAGSPHQTKIHNGVMIPTFNIHT